MALVTPSRSPRLKFAIRLSLFVIPILALLCLAFLSGCATTTTTTVGVTTNEAPKFQELGR
jgi:hypothetical protein